VFSWPKTLPAAEGGLAKDPCLCRQAGVVICDIRGQKKAAEGCFSNLFQWLIP